MQSNCVKVPKREGESTRKMLAESEVIDYRLKIKSDEQFVYIPLIPGISKDILSKIDPTLALAECDFEENERTRSVEEILGFAPSFEVIGDIAVVAEEYDVKVGEAIMEVHKNVRTVLVPTTPVVGEFRIRHYRVLCGEDRTTTVYREHGFIYEMDLNKVYFSPRLSTERKRITDQVTDMELVLDMFAGVGPFAIPISKRAMYTIAVDKNPDAVEYLKKNIALNKASRIEAVNMDARDIQTPQPPDRIIMNLPHTAHEFLDVAFRLIATGGIIHYYDIRPETEIFDAVIKMVRQKASYSGCLIDIVNKRIVRSYSPHEYNIVLDIRVVGKQD
ncbi:1-methylguanosine tRNA methyltransferase [Methanocella paludicola SANAE]|uniref:1-methylguanosine tRNA methyltransferase n=1 Tax=Methanocella paludicola (strain DSM 17711 / JCM 13418 / NBRC 101707 / SANAE) TaxID=304371 RepID=D1YX25_METPS|nr:class I SAM-dependent methyltransferase family protein [Methanocella paludicola]BAI60997.1 1-methylguanosine tRNA methyltransferase [Methanocella paludicola SANAE]